jgi:8-oxo-dGTP pyrophosphatase MutT (NUDIX family)
MIRPIAICLFRHDDRILVAESTDTVKQDNFARPLGGGIEIGETSAQAIAREIREELGQTITNLHLLGVLENIFEYQGKPGHEIVFVYDAHFADSSVYQRPELTVNESGWSLPARWRPLNYFSPHCRLVPEGLSALLARATGS